MQNPRHNDEHTMLWLGFELGNQEQVRKTRRERWYEVAGAVGTWTTIDGISPAGATSLNDSSTTRTLSRFKSTRLTYRRLLRVQGNLMSFKIALFDRLFTNHLLHLVLYIFQFTSRACVSHPRHFSLPFCHTPNIPPYDYSDLAESTPCRSTFPAHYSRVWALEAALASSTAPKKFVLSVAAPQIWYPLVVTHADAFK